jgi:N-acetylglucosaminyldiphosphoundecaprenol N-acetyl-beta-D-mannosaminyltransferase
MQLTEPISPAQTILGMPVNVFSSHEAAAQIIGERMSAGLRTFCTAMNPEKVYRARRDPNLRRILQSADIRICDGVGVSLACKLLYGKTLPRCTGIDVFLSLIALSAKKGWQVFLLGASPESNRGACIELVRSFPRLKLAGSQHGYFEDSDEMVHRINASGADIVFVAMGSPRQEFWIAEHFQELRPLCCMGVGGSLDVVSGVAKRAPMLFRKTGTEWLFRVIVDPRRARRQVALPLFALDVLKAAFGHRKSPASS